MPTPSYRRVMLKLSGEALMGSESFGIDEQVVARISEELAEVHALGVQLAVVVGGGNIIRGLAASHRGIERVTGDYMGMLATVINALALQDAMEKRGVATRVQSAIDIREVSEPFIRRRAIRHLEKGRAVVLAAGTGNPFFTTDTCAALRATEIEADVLLKATKVDGIYSADPKKNPDAKLFHEITYEQVLRDELKVMDLTAFTMCKQQKLPLVVFNLRTPGNISRVLRGERVGTRINP